MTQLKDFAGGTRADTINLLIFPEEEEAKRRKNVILQLSTVRHQQSNHNSKNNYIIGELQK